MADSDKVRLAREKLAKFRERKALAETNGIVESTEIDNSGIGQALNADSNGVSDLNVVMNAPSFNNPNSFQSPQLPSSINNSFTNNQNVKSNLLEEMQPEYDPPFHPIKTDSIAPPPVAGGFVARSDDRSKKHGVIQPLDSAISSITTSNNDPSNKKNSQAQQQWKANSFVNTPQSQFVDANTLPPPVDLYNQNQNFNQDTNSNEGGQSYDPNNAESPRSSNRMSGIFGGIVKANFGGFVNKIVSTVANAQESYSNSGNSSPNRSYTIENDSQSLNNNNNNNNNNYYQNQYDNSYSNYAQGEYNNNQYLQPNASQFSNGYNNYQQSQQDQYLQNQSTSESFVPLQYNQNNKEQSVSQSFEIPSSIPHISNNDLQNSQMKNDVVQPQSQSQILTSNIDSIVETRNDEFLQDLQNSDLNSSSVVEETDNDGYSNVNLSVPTSQDQNQNYNQSQGNFLESSNITQPIISNEIPNSANNHNKINSNEIDNNTINLLRENISELNNSLKEKDTLIDTLKKDYENKINHYIKQISEFQSLISEKDSKIAKLGSELVNEESKVSKLKNELSETYNKANQSSTKNNDISFLIQAVADLTDSNKSLCSKLDNHLSTFNSVSHSFLPSVAGGYSRRSSTDSISKSPVNNKPKELSIVDEKRELIQSIPSSPNNYSKINQSENVQEVYNNQLNDDNSTIVNSTFEFSNNNSTSTTTPLNVYSQSKTPTKNNIPYQQEPQEQVPTPITSQHIPSQNITSSSLPPVNPIISTEVASSSPPPPTFNQTSFNTTRVNNVQQQSNPSMPPPTSGFKHNVNVGPITTSAPFPQSFVVNSNGILTPNSNNNIQSSSQEQPLSPSPSSFAAVNSNSNNSGFANHNNVNQFNQQLNTNSNSSFFKDITSQSKLQSPVDSFNSNSTNQLQQNDVSSLFGNNNGGASIIHSNNNNDNDIW